MVAYRMPVLSGAERQALLNADAETGAISTRCNVRDDMCRKGYAHRNGSQLLLTDYGRSLRRHLKNSQQEYVVEGVPWSKITEITDLYLYAGLDLPEISHRTRVTVEGVEAALAFRKVLVGS